jgi:hypothetical protein
MSEHLHEDDLEERDDIVDGEHENPDPGESRAKTSAGRDPDEEKKD